jgi:hypothetical protein
MALVSAGSLAAHHGHSRFDTTTAVWVKGAIIRYERVSPHALLILDQAAAGGQTQRWVVEGPPPNLLARLGAEPLKIGDVIEVCGYVVKEGVEPNRTVDTEPISLSLKAVTPKTMTGRLLAGEMLVLPAGRRQVWNDYGDHKCLGPDFQDQHVK